MAWGCRSKALPEGRPDGCGWASWQDTGWGEVEWWCDLCERSGSRMARIVPRRSSSEVSVPDRLHGGQVCGQDGVTPNGATAPDTTTTREEPVQ